MVRDLLWGVDCLLNFNDGQLVLPTACDVRICICITDVQVLILQVWILPPLPSHRWQKVGFIVTGSRENHVGKKPELGLRSLFMPFFDLSFQNDATPVFGISTASESLTAFGL